MDLAYLGTSHVNELFNESLCEASGPRFTLLALTVRKGTEATRAQAVVLSGAEGHLRRGYGAPLPPYGRRKSFQICGYLGWDLKSVWLADTLLLQWLIFFQSTPK